MYPFSLFLALLMLPGPQEMLREDPSRSGVNTHIYEFIDETVTPAPKGYRPVYLSHYARHGSRNDFEPYGYDYVMEVLIQAQREGILSPEGEQLMEETRKVIAAWDGCPGHLTPRGVYEHQEQARRIYKAYRDIFQKGNRKVRVETSTVPRSILSMSAFTNTLSVLQKNLEFSYESGERFYAYIDNGASDSHKKASAKLLDALSERSSPDWDAVYSRLFTDPQRGMELSVDKVRFNKHIWSIAKTAEASGVTDNIFRHLPEDVIYYWWERGVSDLYINHGNSVEFGAERMPRTEPLVRDILTKAERVLSEGTVCADLKFGHDYPLLAMAGYFGLEEVGARLSFDEIPARWGNPRNIPLGSNMQMIFYRNGEGRVLVKFVYNGVERHLYDLQPVETVYYDWEEVKARFMPPALRLATLQWKDAGKGLEYAVVQEPVFGAMQSISVVRFKAGEHHLDVIDVPAQQADSTSAVAEREGALAAINGSYFDVKALTPTTYVKDAGAQKGKTLSSEVFRVDGMFVTDGKWVRIIRSSAERCPAYAEGYDEALGAGPILLTDGREVLSQWPKGKFYQHRHPRSVIGTDREGYVYLMVIDGRFKEGIGTTVSETAQIARMVGMTEAINLDGGGSSTLWIEGEGVLSHPYDNKRFDPYGQRIVPNVVVVR